MAPADGEDRTCPRAPEHLARLEVVWLGGQDVDPVPGDRCPQRRLAALELGDRDLVGDPGAYRWTTFVMAARFPSSQ